MKPFYNVLYWHRKKYHRTHYLFCLNYSTLKSQENHHSTGVIGARLDTPCDCDYAVTIIPLENHDEAVL